MPALTLALYAFAKLCEQFDAIIFDTTGIISGHSLKHLFSAIGAYCALLAMPRHYKHQRKTAAR